MIKNLKNSNYFKLLFSNAANQNNFNNLKFNLNLLELKRQYLLNQNLYHPDKLSNNSSNDNNSHVLNSTQLNKAYEILKNPLLRSIHLLELNDIQINETDSIENSELLMDILDRREELEECNDENEAEKIRDQNKLEIDDTINHLSNAYQDENLNLAKDLTIKLRYLINLDDAAKDWSPNKPLIVNNH